jgi:hypothetical protein
MVQMLLLGVCLLAGLVLLGRWFVNADPRTMARTLRHVGIGVAVLVILVLAVTRQLGFLLAALPILVPMFLRWRAVANRLKSMRGPSPGSTSGLDTAFLHVELDHDTGQMAGRVRKGRHSGRDLGDLSADEAIEVMAEAQAEDPQTVAILEAWLDRSHGPEWRERATRGEEARHEAGAGAAGTSGGRMTREEAYRMLGLEPGADAQAIKQAHRRLMMKFHPDQGGSDYLAAKLNEAKDILLNS